MTFDNNFWVTSESVNGGAINFTYDNDGRLKSAGDLTITRNGQNGFLTGTALVNASVAIVDSYVYSTFGETASYNAKVGGAAVFDVQYTRDDIGRIVTKTETVGGTTTVYEYGYDVAGRLVSVKEDGVVVSTYDYDANGNRITAVTKTGTYQGFYDLQDRMTKYGDASYTYTANGELLSKVEPAGTTSYNYDVYGNLRGATMPDGTSIEYVIDANNRRIGKKVNGALVQGFIYKDQLEPVAELDGAGNVVARFVYASKGHVPDYMIKGGVIYRIISDHLGSVRLVVKASDGSIAQRIDYDEFGNVVTDSNPGFQPFAFVGGIYDQHTQLTRFGARDYDAITGRWAVKDPILFDGGDHNLYRYVLNNPIDNSDINGMFPLHISFGCAYVLAILQMQFELLIPFGHGDKYLHCVVSCKLTKYCGTAGAAAMGLSKEILDNKYDTDSFTDLIADYEGIKCYWEIQLSCPCDTCECCCGKKYE
ncbi:MAG: RHS repeat-associated core domain-containing protein [Gemmatimonadota bacterium]|nr:RHS repeat-associated core domain-containing protein [Gemmatimonadota bacterium]